METAAVDKRTQFVGGRLTSKTPQKFHIQSAWDGRVKMQTEFALSSTEAEYIGLSRALRKTKPIMTQLKEMHDHGFPATSFTPTV
jgi:hypothetical protein